MLDVLEKQRDENQRCETEEDGVRQHVVRVVRGVRVLIVGRGDDESEDRAHQQHRAGDLEEHDRLAARHPGDATGQLLLCRLSTNAIAASQATTTMCVCFFYIY